jgi:hypothetical protein
LPFRPFFYSARQFIHILFLFGVFDLAAKLADITIGLSLSALSPLIVLTTFCAAAAMVTGAAGAAFAGFEGFGGLGA